MPGCMVASPFADPCRGVACPGNKECSAATGRPMCACSPGLVPSRANPNLCSSQCLLPTSLPQALEREALRREILGREEAPRGACHCSNSPGACHCSMSLGWFVPGPCAPLVQALSALEWCARQAPPARLYRGCLCAPVPPASPWSTTRAPLVRHAGHLLPAE